MTTSPASDEHLWNTLRTRVDDALHGRRVRHLPLPIATTTVSNSRSPQEAVVVESDTGKRLREDSLLLIRGFDSVSSSLSHLTAILDAASQGIRDLAKPSLTDVLKEGILAAKVYHVGNDDDDDQPKQKRRQTSADYCSDDEVKRNSPSIKREEDENHKNSHANDDDDDDSNKNSSTIDLSKDDKLEKTKKLAISMATKASSLARELTTIKSELAFMRNRCALLDEENRRLREGFEEGLRPDEDDLVRLQLEALLAEKSKLASENATLIRENQCLHQLVEYHQLTSQELSASYEHAIQQGICLDFSPFAEVDSDSDEEVKCPADIKAPCTPTTLAMPSQLLEGA